MKDRVYLREWRMAKGLTQPELAARVGTVKSEVSRLEKGTRRMTLDWMKKIARALGISVDELMSVPPMGFGAVSPPPEPEEREQNFSITTLGDITLGLRRGRHAFFSITGDDWEGSFTPGDVLIYDTSRKNTDVAGIFVIEIGGESVARRVSAIERGFTMSCSNAAYAPSKLDAKHKILGRVVGHARRI